MPGRGPVPKPERVRARSEFVEVHADPVGSHELPDDLLPAGESWHPATLRWWRTWVESPLTAELPAVDWRELEACAVIHHEFMWKRSTALAAELRIRVAAFGATPADRLRLKIKVSTGEESPASSVGSRGVADLVSRRSRLSPGA